MLPAEPTRVGYVVKRYPRYSETFIVNEILAHEAAGLSLTIFSLRPPCDTHFQNRIACVRAPVQYLTIDSTKAASFWATIRRAAEWFPDIWQSLSSARNEEVALVHQALLVALAAHEQGIGHLHAHFATEATAVARLAAQMAGISYSFTAHAKDIYHQDASFEDLRRKIMHASSVVTVSDYNLRYLLETFGSYGANIERIYNGLELPEFLYETPYQRAPVITAVGRLVEKKGFADLIEACNLLLQQGVKFQCRIIGSGELESALRALIVERGLSRHVEMLGNRPQAEVIQLVQQSAVFAAPCVVGDDGNRDGLPTVLLEAMALGTPCVATPVTGIPEAVRDGVTGLIVPEHDPQSLSRALARLLMSAELRVALASAARRRIEADFDIHRNAAKIRELFNQSLCARRFTTGVSIAEDRSELTDVERYQEIG